MDCSLPGSSVHGTSQARIPEWVAISFSRGSSWARDWTWISCGFCKAELFTAEPPGSLLTGTSESIYTHFLVFVVVHSYVWLSATPWTTECQASLSFTVLGVCSNSSPLSWWCHPTISFSVTPFSSCPQSFPASGSFPISQHFTSGGQNIGASASASVLPMNIQGWSPLGLTALTSLLSKGLSRVFPGSSDGKESAYNAEHLDLIPGLGRSPEEGNGYPLQYSCLEKKIREGWIV